MAPCSTTPRLVGRVRLHGIEGARMVAPTATAPVQVRIGLALATTAHAALGLVDAEHVLR